MSHSPSVHVPILLNPIVEALVEPFKKLGSQSEPHWILDCTLGGGGHTRGLLSALAERPELRQHGVFAIDRDPAAIERARVTFKSEIENGRLVLHHGPFGSIKPDRPVLGVLADLGLSSDQMDQPERGFSFQSAQTLDMRMDPTRGQPAAAILKSLSEKELADIIYQYGDERFSRRIASAICRARSEGRAPVTGLELADIIRGAVPPPARHGRIHPATRSFQALRIFVNQELEELDCLLQTVILSLKQGGRVAILSFHSLEDRRVKNRFRQLSQRPEAGEGEWKLLSKKPIDPDEAEIEFNPRARSAHLRLIERLA